MLYILYYSGSWVKKLIIPTRFSKSTMDCIDMGVLSPHARDEIINSVSTCILLYTVALTPEKRRSICQRLVSTIPILKDSIGTGYVSSTS